MKSLVLSPQSTLLEKYQLILFKSAIGLWEWNRETGKIYCDQGLCKLYEVDSDQIEGPPEAWYSLIVPEDLDATKKMMDLVWQDKAEIDSMFRIRTANGICKNIRTSAIKIYDQNHKVSHLVGLNWDVTRETTLKKDLSDTKAFLENLIDAVPDPIFVKNRKHQWIFANQEFSKLLGVPKEKIYGKSDGDFFEQGMVNTYWKYDEQVFSTGEPSENEETVRNSKGETREILTKKSLIPQQGAEPSLVGIIRDITEIKKIQKSFMDQSKLASLGEVSAGMAHEINNPLSIVSGKMMLLKSQIDRGQAIDQTRLIQTCDAVLKNCQRIEKIVKALNSFSRNSERDPLEEVPIFEIVEELREMISDRLQKLDIQFEILYSHPDLRLSNVRARQSEIMQVLINLINNSIDAVRADKKRWIKVSISINNENFLIDVMDSGQGIKNEIADRMMEFFFTTKPAGHGTGLGLSLAKQIIQSHGGKLSYLTGLPNTTFRIELPK